MGRRRDWNKVREIDAKIKELGLYYREGADRFGIDVGVLYEYSRPQKKKSSGSDSTTTKWTARANLYWAAGACSQDWGVRKEKRKNCAVFKANAANLTPDT